MKPVLMKEWTDLDELFERIDQLRKALNSGNVIKVCEVARDVIAQARQCREMMP